MQQTRLTHVVSWTFIKRCGLDLLQQRVGSGVAIQHEPYLGSVAVHDHGHLRAAENRLRRRSRDANKDQWFYLRVSSADSVEGSCHAGEEVT